MQRLTLSITFVVLLTALAVLLAGCGSGEVMPAATSGAGRLVFTVHWMDSRAAQTRLITQQINSVTVTLNNGDQEITHKTVARPNDGSPTSQVTFDNLPTSTLDVQAESFTSHDGSGAPVKTAAYTVPVEQQTTAQVAVGTDTLVASVSASVEKSTLNVGDTTTAKVSAADAAGTIILLVGDKIVWNSSDTKVATVTGKGTSATITGVGGGTATITVTDSESGKTATLPITVAASTGGLGLDIK